VIVAVKMRHLVAVLMVVGMRALDGQAAQEAVASPIVPGELRQFVIAADPPSARDALHRAGWVEADGRLLRRQDFPELYAQIGRAYTRAKTAKEFFAVPTLVDRRNDPNPYGVLGPGDLITSGLPVRVPPAPTYFIYVGRDARSVPPRWK
jgi:tail collar domain